MRLRCAILTAGVCLAAATAWAIDTVKTFKDPKPIVGTVSSMSPYEVVVDQTAGKKQIPVNDIVTIVYTEDPPPLRTRGATPIPTPPATKTPWHSSRRSSCRPTSARKSSRISPSSAPTATRNWRSRARCPCWRPPRR